MIIVKITGGLGNQMFCYAYAKALQKRGHEVKIDNSAYYDTYKLHKYQLDKYSIDLLISSKSDILKIKGNTLINKILSKMGIIKQKVIKEKTLLFDKKLLKLEDEKYVYGYFQSEKYFKEIRSILIKNFRINTEMSFYTKKIKKFILKSKNSCSIHVRRGDYLSTENKKIYNSCNIEYYHKAIKLVKNKFNELVFFVFSDDILWAKNNLKIKNVIYIDNKENNIPNEEIYLMSLCKHNVIANSSFSWWGAWLNEFKEKIVIAPKKWFKYNYLHKQSLDIVCEDWIKI